jgi:hypothetical protein
MKKHVKKGQIYYDHLFGVFFQVISDISHNSVAIVFMSDSVVNNASIGQTTNWVVSIVKEAELVVDAS